MPNQQQQLVRYTRYKDDCHVTLAAVHSATGRCKITPPVNKREAKIRA